MDFLSTLFLESPLWLAGFCFLALAATLLARQRMEGPARRLSLPSALGAAALLFTLQSLVTTQREAIVAVLHEFVEAVERQDATALGDCLAEDYHAEDMDKPAFVAWMRRSFERVKVYDSRLPLLEVTVNDGEARMRLGARATVSLDGQIGQLHTGRWRLEWRLGESGWRIVSIQPEMIDTVPVATLRQLGDAIP